MMTRSSRRFTPSQTLPAKGRVSAGSLGGMVPNPPILTSPLAGEVGRGALAMPRVQP